MFNLDFILGFFITAGLTYSLRFIHKKYFNNKKNNDSKETNKNSLDKISITIIIFFVFLALFSEIIKSFFSEDIAEPLFFYTIYTIIPILFTIFEYVSWKKDKSKENKFFIEIKIAYFSFLLILTIITKYMSILGANFNNYWNRYETIFYSLTILVACDRVLSNIKKNK